MIIYNEAMKITTSIKRLAILRETIRLEYAAYYHQNKVNNGGKNHYLFQINAEKLQL